MPKCILTLGSLRVAIIRDFGGTSQIPIPMEGAKMSLASVVRPTDLYLRVAPEFCNTLLFNGNQKSRDL